MNNSVCNKAVGKLLVVLFMLSLLSSSSSPTLAVPASQGMQSMDGTVVVLKAGDTSVTSRIPPPEALPLVGIQSATFNVTYVGSWSSAARNAFQHAMNIWASQVNSTVPIQVVTEWKSLGENILVTGGPTNLFSNFAGAPVADTWYPVTLANQLAGMDLMPNGPDISVTINSDFNWYLGADGNTPTNQVDLVTSGLAGLGFGLGFFSSMDVSSGQGSWGWGTGYPYVFDHFVVNGSGQSLINTNLFPNPSSALAIQLTSNNIFFNGINARGANGGTNPRLYAPSTWQPGLSIGHLDEDTYPPGDPNALMTPFLNFGEAVHQPGPITLGILRDIDWSTESPPPSPEVSADLQIQMADALPSNFAVQPYITVINQNNTPATYTIVVQLWRGFSKLREKVETISFGWAGQQSLTFNLGVQPPGNYYIWAELWHNGEQLEAETHSFVIGLSYSQLEAAVKDFTNLAHAELNQAEEIAVYALARALVSSTADSIEFIATKIVPKLPGLSEIIEVTDEVFSDFVVKLVEQVDLFDKGIEFIESNSSLNPDPNELAAQFFRCSLNTQTFNQQRSLVDEAANSFLLEYAQVPDFIWKPEWQDQLVRHQANIRDTNETLREGLSIDPEFAWPPARRATLVEMEGQFNWLIDFFEDLDKILTFTLYLLVVVILLAFLVKLGIALIGAALAGKFLAVVLFIKGLFIEVSATKLISAIFVLLLFASLVSETAKNSNAPTIVDRHQCAIDYLRSQIEGNVNSQALSAIEITSEIYGNDVSISTQVASDGNGVWLETQLFRSDGLLVDIMNCELTNAQSTESTIKNLPDGSYWAIAVAQGESDLKTQKIVIDIATPDVTLDLVISDPHLSPGELVEATITLTNQNSVDGTGPLILMAKTLENEGLQVWLPELGPGQSITHNHTFTPESEGSHVLRATISSETEEITSVDRAFVVGSGPAVALNFSPQSSYQPGQNIVWAVTADNVGQEPATATVLLKTYDRNSGYETVFETQHTFTINAGGTTTFNLTALPTALPGAYSTYLTLGDQLYRIEDYLVEAEGALFAIVQADPVATSVSNQVTLAVEVQDETYAPISANVTLWLTTPTGTLLDIPLTEISVGQYQGSYVPDIPGTYLIEVIVSKTNYAGTTGNAFFIVDNASTLFLKAEGDLTVGKIISAIFQVHNELQLSVSEATVIASGAHGTVTGQTDQNGTVSLLLQPVNTDPITVRVEKPGFASTSLQLPVTAKIYLPVILRD